MSEGINRHEVLKVRKAMWLGIPVNFFLLAITFSFGVPEFFGIMHDIESGAPVVRTSVVFPGFIVAMPLWILVPFISILKAIPVNWRGIGFLVKLLNINIFAIAVFMIVGMPILTLAQYHYMPKLGYSKCNELQGHPTMWFNDWVKNPEWCVRGKDRAWVLQQAQETK
ncbi:hypothetical protein [Paracidovorax konjaci]|uniref:hypothetical protein n=1 Tax=Paracidovorax konjaci TaxID=32040 RepID=UPI000A8ACEF9|nr:hypothetical protein [Paracidovorax konjaci]